MLKVRIVIGIGGYLTINSPTEIDWGEIRFLSGGIRSRSGTAIHAGALWRRHF